jgi:hypothetical protein
VFGHSFVSRLVTQMYFPGDPLFAFDPIFNSVPDEGARMRMVSSFDLENTRPEWALCYRFDIMLRGKNATPSPGGDPPQERVWVTEVVEQVKESSFFSSAMELSTSRRRPFYFWLQTKRTISPEAS